VSVDALFYGFNYAHRGLWRTGGCPENSLAAFEKACASGFGIELDVRLTADGEAIVFHDETLDRLTIESGLVEERTIAELTLLRLLGSDQFIPTLAQALEVVRGRTSVLVELKTPPGQEGALEEAVAHLLKDYNSWCGVLSFNPHALRKFGELTPGLPIYTGLNCTGGPIDPDYAKVNFISASVDFVRDPEVQEWRRRGLLAVAWTLRSRAQMETLQPFADTYMFEGFDP
jgi:glycerophosphoryl diester phosphodiesterase